MVYSPTKGYGAHITVDKGSHHVSTTLNRAESYNALLLEMTRGLSKVVSEFSKDEAQRVLFIRGAGGKAFCAGGDLKSLYYEGMAYKNGESAVNEASTFFSEEYALNAQIKKLEKPYVSWLNGIVMGGGYGVSGHGSHLVATELTKFAMPEVKIGFFPDIGATYNLNQCPDHIGLYLALSGTTIGAYDMVYAGLANVVMDSHDIDLAQNEIIETLGEEGASQDYRKYCDIIDGILLKYHKPHTEPSMLEQNKERIKKCFSAPSVESIMDTLKSDGSDWAMNTLGELEYACPTSLCVTFEQMKHVRNMSFTAVMAQDLTLASHFIMGDNLYEGIHETVISKTRSPKWKPRDLKNVLQSDVENYFKHVNLL